jgi:glutamyl-tRNA synthetase
MESDTKRALQRIAGGEKAAVRFKVPEGETVYTDLVHGEVQFRNEKLEDFVILRNDGSPTYMLSVVADDVHMKISHVIRGDDHIANTPKQIMLYRALGHDIPQFAHLPLILGPDKKKLSKRHGGNTMKDYMIEGYLPKAVFNFLALLGWNPGDEREVMSADELIKAFSFEGVGSSAAVFDTDKLEWINGQWINRSTFKELFPAIKAEMETLGTWDDSLTGEQNEWFRAVVELTKDRSRRTWDIARDSVYFFKAPDAYDEKAVRKFCKGDETPGRVTALAEALADLESWTAENIENALRILADRLEIGAGKLIHPLRIGITGLGVTPDVFTIAELLGREVVVDRLKAFASHLH